MGIATYINCVLIEHGLAFGAGAVIFFFTLIIVARKLIGFLLSLTLLLGALGVTLGIDKGSSLIDDWNGYAPEAAPVKSITAPGTPKSTISPNRSERAPRPSPEKKRPYTREPSTPMPTLVPAYPSSKSNQYPNDLGGQASRQKQRVETFSPPQPPE